ncbi:penicillin acylase family protein [Microbacterium invictum]|uniref:Penicillin amidase n=1 Tax=Microbacterium invictum TaxID=515415 RepID=A0AA40SQJ6_9MICO|nr:penicillin acylase family protein [Microbacterium invictum]MBB4140570.1 penicillin amidase [Microbacterium invictum]
MTMTDVPETTDEPTTAKPKRSLGRKIGIAVFSVIAGVTVLALIAAGVVVWTIQRSFPQLEGTVAAPGLDADVTVYRDELGIPTVVADSTDDLFYAQGYVHAQDRFWEMDFRRHLTGGRLAELFGQSQVATDSFLRTLGWHEIAAEEVAALDETTLGYYEAYAEGVNAYLADHDGAAASLEYAVLGLQNPDYEIEPWTPVDSVAWLKAMAWDLRANIESETDRAILAQDYTAEQIADLYPAYPYDTNPVIVPVITEAPAEDPASSADDTDAATASVEWAEVGSVIEAVSTMMGSPGEGIGSNSWVVSGALTESGHPLLANDPHLGAALPSVWHQMGLRCATVSADCAFDVAGFGFSGVPGIIIGHNAQIAWGFTNLGTDVADLYLEKVDGDSYWYDGELVPLQTRTETIRVAGGADVELEIRSTGHGPIVSGLTDDLTAIAESPYTGSTDAAVPASGAPEGDWAVSMRWTALEPGTTAASIFALNLAQDFDGFRAAARQFNVPAQNLVYADVEGNIGYQTPGNLPIRGAGDGSMPQPGWDSAYDWRGYIPFEELPTVYNPESGYIVTANNAVVGEDYPYFLTNDWDYGWRAARITDLIERTAATKKLTADDMSAIQADQEFWTGRQLSALAAGIEVDGEGTREALTLLERWDAQNRPDSAAAAYANVLWDELVQNMFSRRDADARPTSQSRMFEVVDQLLDEPDSTWWTNAEIGVDGQEEMLARSAEDAYERLVSLQGDNATLWNWGSLHALPLTHGTFGSSGIAPIEALFNRGPYPVGGGASVVDATGWVLASGSFETVTVPSLRMTVDLADLDASRWNNLTGASGHAFHPNYTDQTEAWQQNRQTPWLFTVDRLAEDATHTLVLTPAS